MSSLLEQISSMPQPTQLHSEPPAQIHPQITPPHNQPQLDPAAPSKPVVPEEFKYKNYLQEYTQKAGLPLPVYNTVWEGASHSPMFRSTVLVNGVSYTANNVFPTRKAAEMDVAKLALRSVLQQPPQVEECSISQQELSFCKAILKEYADKKNLENPSYKTEKGNGLCSGFISSITFNGKHYVGEEGRNKKESQHLAARAVILSILDSGSDSDAHSVISKIIKSKKRMLYPAKFNVTNPCNAQNVGIPAGILTISNAVTSASKESEPLIVNDNMVKTAKQEPCTGNSSNASAEPVSLVEASATLNLDQLIAGSTSSKKRKRKTKKAEKEAGSDAQVLVNAAPLIQDTASTECSDQISAPNSSVSLPGSDNAVLSET